MVQQTGQIVVQATELRKDFAMGDDTVQGPPWRRPHRRAG